MQFYSPGKFALSAMLFSILVLGFTITCSLSFPGLNRPETPTSTAISLPAGVLATFKVDGQVFRVWIKHLNMYDLERWRSDYSDEGVLVGILDNGSGEGMHNAPWSWHLDPDSIKLSGLLFEGCLKQPDAVEKGMIEASGGTRFCMERNNLISLQDYN